MDKLTRRNQPAAADSSSAGTQYQILIAPIGEFEISSLHAIEQAIEHLFGFTSQIQPLLHDIAFAFDAEREQYYSTQILEKLAAAAPAHVLKVLAITSEDLFIPILTHVYGEAQLGGTACIVSTARLEEGLTLGQANDIARTRLVKEALHELGHTFNLRHCPDHGCCMHYCRSMRDVDRKSEQLCRHCRVLVVDEIKRL
jgi:archaemetzincin